jgi:hypothetical protein
VRFAESERALCTTNDARGFELMTVYDKAARRLREIFCGKDWERDDSDNQAGIRNAALKLRVIPCNFDEDAGNPLVEPTNRVAKGEGSRAKSRCNGTGWLPGLEDIPAQAGRDYVTWILGIYAQDGKSLKAELSLPIDFAGNHFTRFGSRIILLDGTEEIGGSSQSSRPDRPGPTEEIDIAIPRK